MRWILVVFGLLCFALAELLYTQAQAFRQRLQVLTAENRPVEQNAQLVRMHLKRTEIMLWASVGGGVLLIVSAVVAGLKKGTPTPSGGEDA